MKRRDRRRYLFAWLPRGALILAALLAPLIDRSVASAEAHAAAAAHPPADAAPEGCLGA